MALEQWQMGWGRHRRMGGRMHHQVYDQGCVALGLRQCLLALGMRKRVPRLAGRGMH
jgi:hypothetical protein